MFHAPKGCLLADSCRGPILFTYVLFWVTITLQGIQFISGFLKIFFPPEGLCGSEPQRGPIVFTYALLV